MLEILLPKVHLGKKMQIWKKLLAFSQSFKKVEMKIKGLQY